MNHCVIPVNKIYTQLADILEEEELFMNRLEDEYEIKQIIRRLVHDLPITESRNYRTSDENYVAMTHVISNSIADKEKERFFETVYMEMNDDYTYQLVYNESRGTDENLNDFATIANNEQMPIYDTCCIVKASNKQVSCHITKEDVANIYINMYYHIGLMVRVRNVVDVEEELEWKFVGDLPEPYLPNGFVKREDVFFCGLNLAIYGDNEPPQNQKVSTLFGKPFYGNIIIAMACPVSGKYYSNFTRKTFATLLELRRNNYVEHVERNVMEIAGNNPFLVIEKYK
jgi:hypothetical protein